MSLMKYPQHPKDPSAKPVAMHWSKYPRGHKHRWSPITNLPLLNVRANRPRKTEYCHHPNGRPVLFSGAFVHVGKHYICTMIRKMARYGQTDPICGPGYNRCFTFDRKTHPCSPIAAVLWFAPFRTRSMVNFEFRCSIQFLNRLKHCV